MDDNFKNIPSEAKNFKLSVIKVFTNLKSVV